MRPTTQIELDRHRSEVRRATTMLEAIRNAVHSVSLKQALRWPSDKYKGDPVLFAKEVLGIELWSKQIEICEAIRDNQRVAVSSGHKIGKSCTIAVCALWFYCSFNRARVVMTSRTARQVEGTLWREIGIRYSEASKKGIAIDGTFNSTAKSGLKSLDYREVVGFTARDAEAVAGTSGENLLYLVDEASGVEDVIFEAIDGNMADDQGARMAMFSNPTRTTGEFFEAIAGRKQEFYKTFTVSSLETPNAVTGKRLFPGLAGRKWCEQKKLEYGENSPFYFIRVLGKHALHEDGKILSVHDLTQAQLLWHDIEAEGRLCIGVDPAGESGGGDESAFACRRGKKIFALHAKRGMNEDAHLIEILGLISEHRRPTDGEKPLVILDRDGSVGAKVWGRFLSYVLEHEAKGTASFELIGVRGSELAKRRPLEYHLVRDEMWMVFADWVRDGGAIPEDKMLEQELHAPSWEPDLRERACVTAKKELRAALGRSPDRGDACVLSVWTPADYEKENVEVAKANEQVVRDEEVARVPTLDPYSGGDAWGPRRR